MLPDPDALSLAERVQAVVEAPVAAGLHSIAAANLDDAPARRGCADLRRRRRREGARARVRRQARRRPGARRGPARERPGARRADGGDRQPEPALQGPRRRAHHRRRRRGVISLIPVHGLPEIREGDDLAAMIVELIELADDDVVVIAQKAVSKAEGRVIRIDSRRGVGARDRAGRRRARPARGRGHPARGEADRARARAARDRRDRARLHLRLGRRRPFERARAREPRAAPGRSRRLAPGWRATAIRELTGRTVGVVDHRLVRAAVPAGDDRRRDRRRRAFRRSSTCAGRPTGSATSSARAGSRSPTRSPPRPTWHGGKPRVSRPSSSGACGSKVTERRQEIVIEHELDLF